MLSSLGGDDARHFNGFNTRLVVDYLQREYGHDQALRVLEQAGDTRALSVLLDDGSWSSYGQIRRLLEATATLIGPEAMRLIGADTTLNADQAESVHALQSLESVVELFRESAASGSSMGMATILKSGEVDEPAPGSLVLRQGFQDGFEPFKQFCWYVEGLLSLTLRLFGLPKPEVQEIQCQCDGAEFCTFILRIPQLLTVEDSLQQQLAMTQSKLEVLESRFASFQDTVTALVSNPNVADTLTGIARSAAKVLRAPAYLLHLPGQSVVSSAIQGPASFDAATIVANLSPEMVGAAHVPVASQGREYGRLIVIEEGRSFRAHESDMLASYGRLAAAAIDAAAALHEARRQADTATALLELSAALGSVVTLDEAAARLASALPLVVDCDRALVILSNETNQAYVAASHGYPTEVELRLLGMRLGTDLTSIADATMFLSAPDGDDHDEAASLMRLTGSVAAVCQPIQLDGSCEGLVVVSVVGGSERLAPTPELSERLAGLAGQGATAIRNSRLMDEVRHQALHDSLTRLPNRALLSDRAEHMLKRARRNDSTVGVMFVDLDGFKDVNDTLGHAAGDELLRKAAARLTQTIRDCDTVGRIGGDEFIVLFDGELTDEQLVEVGERILTALRRPFDLIEGSEQGTSISASIGLATGCPQSSNDLMRNADTALYRAKATGKNRIVVFDPEMGLQAETRRQLEIDLNAALENDEFFLVYQPLFDLPSDSVTGVEALLRWQSDQRGLVPPDVFVPLLESNGQILPVGRFVLQAACLQGAKWLAQGLDVEMSVNISPVQLGSESFVDDLVDCLTISGFPATSLILEITETALMHDVAQCAARLQAARELGVRVAIDDFGIGYSSMAYLRQLPVDMLKIDRSFVSAMADSAEACAIVENFVQLGRSLGLHTLAEGIEEPQQLQQLREHACDAGQGFLLGRPGTVEEVERFLLGCQQRTA